MGDSSFPLPMDRDGNRACDSGTSRGRTAPVPRRVGSGAANGRARLPLTSQVDAVGGSGKLAGGQVVEVERPLGPAGGQPLEPERQPGDDQ